MTFQQDFLKLCSMLLFTTRLSHSLLTRSEAVVALTSGLSLRRLTIACRMGKQELALLEGSLNVTLILQSNLEEIQLVGNLVVCSDDIGWSRTLQFLQAEPNIGLAQTAIILHHGFANLSAVPITVSQKVFFVNMTNGLLEECYQTGQLVKRKLGVVRDKVNIDSTLRTPQFQLLPVVAYT